MQDLKFILSQLTDLVNHSIETGYIPQIFNIANVLPLHKSKEQNQLTNYIPISVLPSLSKVMERFVYKILYDFLDKHNISYKSPYGFRKNNSTIHAVAEFLKERLLAYERSEHTIAILYTQAKCLIQ